MVEVFSFVSELSEPLNHRKLFIRGMVRYLRGHSVIIVVIDPIIVPFIMLKYVQFKENQ